MLHSWHNQPLIRHQDWRKKCIVANGFCTLLLKEQFKEQNPLAINANQLNHLIATGEQLKHDRTTTVVRTHDVIIKRYNPRNRLHTVKRALRRSRAYRSWLMSYAFERAGLNVAQPILMYEQRFGALRADAYFVSTNINAQELLTLLPSMSSQEQNQVASAINSAFNKMRQHKISHGDMKASNLLWRDNTLYFIDLDAAQQHCQSITWAMSHRKDVKRFLKNWQNQPELLSLFNIEY